MVWVGRDLRRTIEWFGLEGTFIGPWNGLGWKVQLLCSITFIMKNF